MSVVVYTGTREPSETPENIDLWHMPMLEVEPIEVSRERLERLTRRHAGLVVYSKNAVRALRRTGAAQALAPFDRHTWWSVGEKTANFLHREFGVAAHHPSTQNFEGLKRELATAELPDSVVAFSLEGKDRDLQPVLKERGISFEDLPVYRTVPVTYQAPERRVRGGDWLVFTSPRGVRTFYEMNGSILGGETAEFRVAAIGPKTAEALADFDIEPTFVPDEPSRRAILAAIATIEQDDRHQTGDQP